MGRGNAAIPGLIVVTALVMGLFIAALQQIAYDNSFLLNLYLDSAEEVQGLQVITVVLFGIIGSIFAALKS